MSSDLLEILRSLNPSEPNGFEGLIAALLESLTGRHFNLALSGSQEGRDMSSRQVYANLVAVECKRYGPNTTLDSRELLGELAQVERSIPDLDIWVLVASRDVPSQLEEALHETAADYGIEFLSISSGDGSPSSLEALCAYSPEIVIAHQGVRSVAEPEKVGALLQQVSVHPQYQQRVEALKAAFSSPLVGYENWRSKQNGWFLSCLKSERETRANFGQPINVEDKGITLIRREAAWASMSEWLRAWTTSRALRVVLGEEGDGKTWSVASWLSQNVRNTDEFPAVVFLSSTDVNSQDPAILLSNVISRRLRSVSGDQAQRRLCRWMRRSSGGTPLLLLVLDGINQHRGRDWWRALLEKLAEDPWREHVAVVLTCRTSYWQPYFSSLRHLSASVLTIPPYDDSELDAALARHNLHRDEIHDDLMLLIRKPRYFDLMVKHRDRIAESGDVTIARLIYEDWRDRLGRKQGVPLTDEDFRSVIRRLAGTYQCKGPLLSDQDIANTLPLFEDRQSSFEELRTGGVLQPREGMYEVDRRLLTYGFGLLLADQVAQAAANKSDLRETIAAWLEPQAEMDIKAEICEFAALHALGIGSLPSDAKAALLHAWIDSRNPRQQAESDFTAYLPVDPQSYVELAETVWSDTCDNAWAQELLIRSFLRWHATPKVSPVLRSAFERWLGFVHIYGSPFGRETTEDAEEARQQISQRVGKELQRGPFSFADYPLTAIQDDGQMRLGRAALAVISYLPRNQFIHAIAVGCVAEAIMGRPHKYDLFAWVVRTSSQAVWSDVRKEVIHLLSSGSEVAQQSAYRLLSFEGSQDAHGIQETMPESLFPPNQLMERHRQDPCTSGFTWTAEDCIICLPRLDLPVDWVARQIKEYCIDPDLPVPNDLKFRFSSLAGKIDTRSVWLVLGPTEADHLLETYEPALAAYAASSLADLVRTIARQIEERQGMSRRQLSYHLTQPYLILTSEDKEAIYRAWDQLISEADTWGEAEETAEMFLFKVVLVNLSGDGQLSCLLRRPESALDLLDYKQRFLPIGDWGLVRDQLEHATSTKSLSRILWFISAHPSSVPHDILGTSVMPLLNHEDSFVRSLVLEIAYGAKEVASIETVIQRGWKWSTSSKELENHWGSLVLCQHGLSMPFAELCSRVHPMYLGYAVVCRGNRPSEVRTYAESIHQVWSRLSTVTPAVPVDLPDLTVDSSVTRDVRRFNLRGFPEGTFSRSVTFRSPHESWGGSKGKGLDLAELDPSSFDERQQKLLKIAREAVEQQEAAGNLWFGREFRRAGLDEVVKQRPDLVAKWVQAAITDDSDALCHLNRSSSFYAALCAALLGEDVDKAVALYWRLQEAGARVHVIDQDTGMEILDFDLFSVPPSDTLTNAWKSKLEQCNTDQELLKVAVLSQYGTGKDWLWSYIAERVESAAPVDRARSILLLGFFDDQKALEALQQLLQSQPDTWLRKLAKTSKQRWDRNTWAKHWFRRFLTVEDDVTAWASFRLFLQCIDTRFWFWRQDSEAAVGDGNVGVQRRMFLRDNMESIRKSIRDNEKDLAEQFLGHKILNGQVWPWMPFSLTP